MIYCLCGLEEEANTITDRDNVRVLVGTAARDNLASLVGPDCEALVSWGTAGSVRKEVAVGGIVLPMFVCCDDYIARDPSMEWQNCILRAFKASQFPSQVVGTYSGPIEVAATAAQKMAIADRHNMVVYTVDEITYAVAKLAAERNVPWIAVQAVSDAYDQTVPPVADADATNADGTPNFIGLIDGLIHDPSEIPGTIEVAETFSKAISALSWAYSVIQPWFLFEPGMRP
jgi:hypothetical protein